MRGLAGFTCLEACATVGGPIWGPHRFHRLLPQFDRGDVEAADLGDRLAFERLFHLLDTLPHDHGHAAAALRRVDRVVEHDAALVVGDDDTGLLAAREPDLIVGILPEQRLG
jgi:hypothetical protein